jgi:dihydropteroate synthase
MTPLPWRCRGRRFEIADRPLILGIVNVTPDSFSDGGRFLDPAVAVEHALKLAADGADLLDVGGESTRPGSQSVSIDEELRRVVPVIRDLAKRTAVPVSVDTNKAEVARQALDTGASVVNDITGLCGDPDMPAVCREYGAGVIVMHMQGTPATMQANPTYRDVVREVEEFFRERLRALADAGIDPEAVCLDPGVGFGKTVEHNLALVANLREFGRLGRPVCLGVSRKGFIGRVVGGASPDRLVGSLAAACYAMAGGAAQVLRVHDVAPTRDAAATVAAINRHRNPIPF